MTARRTRPRCSPRAGSPRTGSISAGRSTSPSFPTDRSWSPTTSPAPSTASGTRIRTAGPRPSRGAALSFDRNSGMSRCHRAGLLVVLAVLPFVALTPAAAGDAAAGRRKATQCQACHGLDGLSKLPEAPHLAGQPERYLVKSLDEYRNGTRSNEMMSIVAKMLSDQDVADLAAYYAAIEISVTPPK